MKYKGLFIVMNSAFALTSCIYVSESENDRHNDRTQPNAEPTIGLELLDVDRARSSGVIFGTEYELAKQAILDDIN
ncbi:MAG: hypothetical protein ACI934_002081 [Pseudohongiellaceae bacterium]|jgi:hypothetical protein